MKASFMGAGTYMGAIQRARVTSEDGAQAASARMMGGTPPGACDRQVASKSLQRTIANCRRAEDLGFDWISCSEHHYAPFMLTPNPLVLAGALSQATKHARIALLGPLLPLANPVRVAEEVAMLDSMSGGRVVVLFLRGTPSEWRIYNDVTETSREMTQEGIQLILKAWTAPESFAWHGKHFNFDNVSVWPRTLQDPHPPVFGSGNSEESAIFAARNRLGLAISFMPAAAVKRIVALYKDEAKRTGWTPTKDHILYRALCTISDSNEPNESAFDRSDKESSSNGRDAPLFVMGAYLTGGPRNVLRQIELLREAGVGIVDMNMNSAVESADYDGQVIATELFARKVLPEIRSW